MLLLTNDITPVFLLPLMPIVFSLIISSLSLYSPRNFSSLVSSGSPILYIFPSQVIIFSLAAFHSLAVLVPLYPRAKHISSIGHSQDQWRGKAQERLKSREGKEEGEGGVAARKSNKKERPDGLL